MRVPVPEGYRPAPAALAPGDWVDYKLTFHIVTDDGVEVWIGYGAMSQVRAGETTAQADERLRRHVEQTIEERAEEIRQG